MVAMPPSLPPSLVVAQPTHSRSFRQQLEHASDLLRVLQKVLRPESGREGGREGGREEEGECELVHLVVKRMDELVRFP